MRNYGTTQDQNTQNLSDIASWFGQAADTQKAGAADNAKAFAAQLAGQGDAACIRDVTIFQTLQAQVRPPDQPQGFTWAGLDSAEKGEAR